MAFRVEISAQAERDAAAILEWLLSQHTGQAGIDWFLSLDNAFASLAEFPERCPIAPENARFNFEVRQLLYGRKPHLYRILFTIESRHRTCPAYPTRSTKTCHTNRIRWKGAGSDSASDKERPQSIVPILSIRVSCSIQAFAV